MVSTPQDTTAEPQPTYMVNEKHAVPVSGDPRRSPNRCDTRRGTGYVHGRRRVPIRTLEMASARSHCPLGGPDGSLFSLTDTEDFGGAAGNNTYELGFKESPNYESPADADGNNKYHVTIITADNEGATP